MRLRTLALAAVVALVPLGALVPAYAAAPDAPVFSALDSSTAGVLTGSISSPGAPEIYVRFSTATGVVTRHVHLTGDTDTFTLPTWGYGGSTDIQASACLTTAQNPGDCSPEAVAGTFTPTDVTPTTTWSDDTTVGPGDQVTVQVTDTGGGKLFAQFDNSLSDPPRLLLADGPNSPNINDGTGQVRIYRCDDLNTLQCVEFPADASPVYDIRQLMTLTWDPVVKISPNHPDTAVQLRVDRAGTYDLNWFLTDPAGVTTGVTGSVTAQQVPAGGALDPVTIPGTTLTASGVYRFQGSLTVHSADPGFGDYVVPLTFSSSTNTSPRVPVDRTGPLLTSSTASPATIYPLIQGSSTYRSSTRFTLVGSGVSAITELRLYRKGTSTPKRTLTLVPGDSTHATATWNGLLDGSPAAAGQYLLKAVDADGNASTKVATVTVSGYRLVSRTWTHTYTPAGTLASQSVARCSTLRSPSLRGWAGSLGYYANTRCSSQTTADSLIKTQHSVILPSAVSYTDLHVNTYGGAARARPGSKIKIRYLTTSRTWVSERVLSGTLGTHAGYTHSATGLVFKDRSFAWGVYTGFGYQYDVKSFTVVLHYKVLG